MKLINLGLMLTFCLIWAVSGNAKEQVSKQSAPQIKSQTEFSWDIAIALDIVNHDYILAGSEQQNSWDYIKPSILLDVYYRGFFIQSNRHRYSSYIEGLEIGYELVVNDNYSLDIISKVYIQGFSDSHAGARYEDEEDEDEKIEELKGITERRYVSNQGLRYMRYLPNAVYWFDVAVDLADRAHRGWVIDGFYSHILQYRNWDINLGAGASFFSSKMNDYYFSVKPSEALDSRPIYAAGSGYRFQLEAFFQRPINESWGFSGGVTLSHYSSSIAKSPIVTRQNTSRAQIGVTYVF